MTGRELKESNDLFFVCSLIEHIARQTKNHRSVVVNALGLDKLQRIYNLADIYHSENIDKVSDELIMDIIDSRNNTPEPIVALIEVYNSWISRKIEDFNSSMYFENPDYIFQSYLTGDVLE